MKQSVKNSATEEHIKATALEVFFVDGNIHATTQEIADKAGVNRALIHYYFRSRDNLFEIVLHEAMKSIHKRISGNILSDAPFRERIEAFIDAQFNEITKYPYLEMYIATEAIRNPALMHEPFLDTEDEMDAKLMADMKVEIEKGHIADIPVEHFKANMMALCGFPFIGRPLLQKMIKMDDAAYNNFLRERKDVIIKLLFRE
ncbi:MAG: TetR/AcrR family transcriptional regulator [Breznakibacter sp.]